MIKMKVEQARKRIPAGMLDRIELVEQRFKKSSEEGPTAKIALFDMDNTLLVGDCGDALFAQLKIDEQRHNKPLTVQGCMIPFTWTEYREVLRTRGKVEAYSRVIKCMAGIPLETLLETSLRAMTCGLPYLELEGVKIQVPYPHPVMQALLVWLESLGYEIYIISATNQFTVRLVAKEYFGVPESHVFGMVPTVTQHPHHGTLIGDEIEGPVTVVEGKVQVYREKIGTAAPVISGGDSTTDIAMLNLTAPDGLIIWVGEDLEEVEEIKKDLLHPEIVYFFDQRAVITT